MFDAEIQSASEQYGVNQALIKAIISIESAWNPLAVRFEPHINDASWGLMQVLLKTAKWMLNDTNLTSAGLLVPSTNIKAGVRYLAWQLNRYGDVEKAIAAYNAGTAKRRTDGTWINQSYVNKVWGKYQEYLGYDIVAQAQLQINQTPIAIVDVGPVPQEIEEQSNVPDFENRDSYSIGWGHIGLVGILVGYLVWRR